MIKAKLLKLLKLSLMYLSVTFTPIVPALLWLGVFVFFDLVTGIYKAKKTGEKVQSKKLGNTVTKLVMYFILILAGKIMDHVFLKIEFLPFTICQAVTGFVSVTEFKSIVENVSTVLGMNVWKFLRNKIDALRSVK